MLTATVILCNLYKRKLETLHLKFGIQGFHNKLMMLVFIYKTYISHGFYFCVLISASFLSGL